jgi:hypothetical protein
MPFVLGAFLRRIGSITDAKVSARMPKETLDIQIRKRALGQGVLGVAGAVGLLLLMGWLQTVWTGSLALGVSGVLFVVGFGSSIYGVWRLGVARNLRWDGWGLLALLLMLVPGYPLVFVYLMLFITGLVGPVYSNR